MSIAPENIPADPRPAIARPAMKTDELGAAPQMTEPTSKIITHVKNILSACVSCCFFRQCKSSLDDLPLHGIKFVEPAEDELCGRGGEHISRAVPANIPQTMKFICYCWYGGGYDGSVKSHQEHGQKV